VTEPVVPLKDAAPDWVVIVPKVALPATPKLMVAAALVTPHG